MALDWAASRDENRRRAWLSSFLPGAHEPEREAWSAMMPPVDNAVGDWVERLAKATTSRQP